jgi:hypothetical protein
MTTRTGTQTSDAYIWPANNSYTSLICDGAIITQVVDDFGVDVRLRVVTETAYNTYGDATESTTDSFTKAYLHQWTSSDDEVKEGIFKSGDLMFVFKLADDAKIVPGTRVEFQGKWYAIDTVSYQMLAGKKYLINAHMKTYT